MTLNQMEKLTIDNIFFTILELMVDFSTIPNTEEKWILLNNPSSSMYDNVVIHSSLTMPTLASMNEVFATYKAQMIKDEKERVEDIKKRIEAMIYFDEAFRAVHVDYPNVAIWIKLLFDNENYSEVESLLVEIETAHIVILEKMTKQNELVVLKNTGGKIKQICSEALDIVRGYNYIESKTVEEIKAMRITFAEINGLLNDGMPATAYKLIVAIDDKGVEDLKRLLINHFNLNGVK